MNILNQMKRASWAKDYQDWAYTELDRDKQRAVYKDYLKSSHWLTTRREAIIRAGFKCEYCGASFYDETLQVHHLTYKNIGREQPEDMQVLCRTCHRKAHLPSEMLLSPSAEKQQQEADWNRFITEQAIANGPLWWQFIDAALPDRGFGLSRDEVLAKFNAWKADDMHELKAFWPDLDDAIPDEEGGASAHLRR